MTFKFETRNWVEYRALPGIMEVDFHFASHESLGAFNENMRDGRERTLAALANAQRNGKSYVLFTHGHSTSGPGRMSIRSVVHGVMRSKDATPFIVRSACIQHPSVFVAAIRPAPQPTGVSMSMDVYDCEGRPDHYLVVRAGSPTAPLINDGHTGVAPMAPLWLSAGGIALKGLVDSTLGGRLAQMIADHGYAILRKTELMESIPDGRTKEEVTPPALRSTATRY